jgi:hypothetical protein
MRAEEVENRYFWLHFFYGAIFLVTLVIVLWFSVTIDAKLEGIGNSTARSYGLESRLVVVENKVNLLDQSLQDEKRESNKTNGSNR